MTDRQEVSAPEKWMSGWNKYLSLMLESTDEELLSKPLGHVGQQLIRAFSVVNNNPDEMQILEFACGDGTTACALAKIGCKVEAFDALPIAIEVSKRKAKLMGVDDKIDFEIATMEKYPLKKYDVIVALQCIQYLFENAIPKLEEIRDSIRPGGFIAYSGNILPHFNTEPRIRFITSNELKKVFEEWTFHCFGTEENLLKSDDLRGYVWLVARKPNE
ncbi:MAG: methyltransferase domain-containing protein [Candidatus Lokiarchaeota archaeon]|nr:methyltransferase domain-containing protein [Candidatus Lokiarchaeota archaeon]